ncbi:MAG: hypothetical protein ACSNEK_04400 [Parachlamydiaceae bacterium]
MSLKRLASNLVEISYTTSPKELVVFGNRIYNSSYGIGRIIKWIQLAFPALRPRHSKLSRQCQLTRQLFFDQIKELEQAEKHLRNGIQERLSGNSFTSFQFDQAKDLLLLFNHYLGPLCKDIRKKRSSRALHFLLDKVPNQEKSSELKRLQELFSRLQFYQRIFIIEEITSTSIPFLQLKKMSFDERLSSSEKRKVNDWLECIEEAADDQIPSFQGETDNSYAKARFLHRFLWGVTHFIRKDMPSNNQEFRSELEALETNLAEHGYTHFEEMDDRHFQWKESLRSGEKIEIDHLELILGEPKNEDGILVYSVANDPELEIVIYHNESWSYLKRFQLSVLHCGVIGRNIVAVSRFGQVVVQERLYETLADICWSDPSLKAVTQEDQKRAQPIIKLLKGLASREYFTPFPLTPQSFAFNLHGELKAVDCLAPTYFSFDLLEDFAWQCAQGNPYVFSYLIKESKLRRLGQAKHYQKLFKETLENAAHAPEAIDQNGLFCCEVRDKFDGWWNGYQEHYDLKKKKQFRKKLIEELCHLQRYLCPGRILVDELFITAFHHTLGNMKVPLRQKAFKEKLASLREEMSSFSKDKIEQAIMGFGIYDKGQIKQVKKELEIHRAQRLKQSNKT